MTLDALDRACQRDGLRVRGACHPGPEDAAPEGTGTLVLLGPDEPGFWPMFQSAPEASDGQPDPLDRWSRRIIEGLATRLEARAVFPADGPPYAPFLRWATASGRCWPAPVGLLVHDAAGLFVSFRGALALTERLALPAPPPRPCDSCAAPCTMACPVGAMGAGQPYDVPRCQDHVASPEGAACREGCLVRRACPVAEDFTRLPAQSAFHMRAFMRNHRA